MKENAQDVLDRETVKCAEAIMDEMPLRKVAVFTVIMEDGRVWVQWCGAAGHALPTHLNQDDRIGLAIEIADSLVRFMRTPPPDNDGDDE